MSEGFDRWRTITNRFGVSVSFHDSGKFKDIAVLFASPDGTRTEHHIYLAQVNIMTDEEIKLWVLEAKANS